MNLYRLISICFFGLLISCSSVSQKNGSLSGKEATPSETRDSFFINSDGERIEKVYKSESEWQDQLSKMEFYVIREKGTERAFTGDLLNIKEEGIYSCKACGMPLFDSSTKYKSGTGWPSFYTPIDSAYILEDVDYDLGYARTEVMCNRCEGHLGHVFNDGPEPTGLRYCINSVSLSFIQGEEAQKALQKF